MTTKIATNLILGMTLLACNPPKQEEPPADDGAAAAAAPEAKTASATAPDADTYFAQKCAACHGDAGKGDGPGAAAMDPKPRDFTGQEWQAEVTDEELKKVILGGGMAVGKSPLMPGSPDLKDKPELLDALVKNIRSYKK